MYSESYFHWTISIAVIEECILQWQVYVAAESNLKLKLTSFYTLLLLSASVLLISIWVLLSSFIRLIIIEY